MNLAIPKEGQSLCLKVRKELGERAQILKEQWLLEKKALPSKYDYRRKKHVKPDPKWGFLHRCAEENFPALHDFPTVSMAFFFFFFWSLSDKIFSVLDQDLIKNLDQPAWFQQGTRLFYTFNDL